MGGPEDLSGTYMDLDPEPGESQRKSCLTLGTPHVSGPESSVFETHDGDLDGDSKDLNKATAKRPPVAVTIHHYLNNVRLCCLLVLFLETQLNSYQSMGFHLLNGEMCP